MMMMMMIMTNITGLFGLIIPIRFNDEYNLIIPISFNDHDFYLYENG